MRLLKVFDAYEALVCVSTNGRFYGSVLCYLFSSIRENSADELLVGNRTFNRDIRTAAGDNDANAIARSGSVDRQFCRGESISTMSTSLSAYLKSQPRTASPSLTGFGQLALPLDFGPSGGRLEADSWGSRGARNSAKLAIKSARL
jgi:hypothetical protein